MWLRIFSSVALLSALPVCAQAEIIRVTNREYKLTVEASEHPQEVVLKTHYIVNCPANARTNGVLAKIAFKHPQDPTNDRRLRLNLFEAQTHLETALGVTPHHTSYTYTIDIEANSDDSSCEIKDIHFSLETRPHDSAQVESLVLEHSPFVVFRADQLTNAWTDVPTTATYAVLNLPNGNFKIRYTYSFTDEDSLTSSDETDAQMTRYGRRNDMEWVYDVEFDPSWRVVGRSYQGFLHFPKLFKGAYLEGGKHPVLYNVGSNNIFSDAPDTSQFKLGWYGHHLVPTRRLKDPEARETILLDSPWLHYVTDQELSRENKISRPFTDHLFVLMNGQMKTGMTSGGFIAKATFNHAESYESGGGHGSIDRLGEDLFGAQSFTAIPVGASNLEKIALGNTGGRGVLSFLKASILKPRVTFFDATSHPALRFYRFLKRPNGTFEAEELTSRFACKLDPTNGLNSHCSF